VDNVSHTPEADAKRRQSEQSARPVLAQLPDVSAELQQQRATSKPAGNVGYRFDPPQTSNRGVMRATTERATKYPTLKSQLVYSPHGPQAQRPHVFARGAADRRTSFPRRESAVLPRSNPFAIPRRSLADSIAPVVRFLTLVALFTAAGTWIQIVKLRNAENARLAEPPATTAQEPVAPTAETADRSTAPPSASGPTGTTPESNTRMGRARENDDFAKLRGDILPIAPVAATAEMAFPDLTNADGTTLPRIRTTEPSNTALEAEAATSEAPPEVAGIPGFTVRKPSR
jgi:hypothetical protein